MATPLRNLLETAWTAHLAAESVPDSVVAGMASGDKTAPLTICKAVSATEDPPNSGNFNAKMRLTSKGLFSAGAAAFQARCDAVRAAVWVSDLATELTAHAPGLTVFGITSSPSIEWDTEEDCWVESVEVDTCCCAHQFSA